MNYMVRIFQTVKELQSVEHDELGNRLLESIEKVLRDPSSLQVLRELNEIRLEVEALDLPSGVGALDDFSSSSLITPEKGPHKQAQHSPDLPAIWEAAEKNLERVWKAYRLMATLLAIMISTGLGTGAFLFADSLDEIQERIEKRLTSYTDAEIAQIKDDFKSIILTHEEQLTSHTAAEIAQINEEFKLASLTYEVQLNNMKSAHAIDFERLSYDLKKNAELYIADLEEELNDLRESFE